MLRQLEPAPAEASGLTSAASHSSARACAYVWHALAKQHRLHVHPLPEQQHAGSFVVPATVYPSPRLTAGSAAVSSSLAASLGRPRIGADLVVYSWPAATAQPSPVQLSGHCCILYRMKGFGDFIQASGLGSMQRSHVQHPSSMAMSVKNLNVQCTFWDLMGLDACGVCRRMTREQMAPAAWRSLQSGSRRRSMSGSW